MKYKSEVIFLVLYTSFWYTWCMTPKRLLCCPTTCSLQACNLVVCMYAYNFKGYALEVCMYAQGVVHITGGGFPENIPRVVPKGKDLGFRIQRSAWAIPPLYQWLQQVTPACTAQRWSMHGILTAQCIAKPATISLQAVPGVWAPNKALPGSGMRKLALLHGAGRQRGGGGDVQDV